MNSNSNDVAICWEKINRINPQFRITYPYAASADSMGLLAIYALFACLDEVLLETSDENVARHKLAWWQSELMPANLGNSRHPVLSVYRQSGASRRIPSAMPARLVLAIDRLLDADALSGEDELVALCEEIYQPRFEIESALSGPAAAEVAPPESLTRPGGMRLLLQVSFCSRQGEGQRFWWIPLVSLAKFGIRRDELLLPDNSDKLKSLVHELLPVGLPAQMQDATPADLHQTLMGHLQTRLLSRLLKKNPESYSHELSRITIGDTFSIWNQARRLRSEVAGGH